MSLWFWLFREKRECLQKMLPRDEVAGCQSGIFIAVDIAKAAGDLKLFLYVVYWIHLIHIQLGTLGLRE